MPSANPTIVSTLVVAGIAAALLSGCGREADPAPTSAVPAPAQPIAPRDSGGPVSSEAPGAPQPGSIFDAAPPSETEIAKAREVLAEVGNRYAAAPTLADDLTLFSDEGTQVMHLRFDRNDERIKMALPMQTATVIGDRLYLTNDLMYDLYLDLEVERDPATTIVEEFQWTPPYHFAMRSADKPDGDLAVESYLSGLGLGILRNPRLRGYALVTEDDREAHRVTLDSPAGSGHVYIDAETMLITSIVMDVLPAPGQPAHASRQQIRIEAGPVIADQLAEPIVFDQGDRDRVTDLQAMSVRTLGQGDIAPNYKFQTAEGEVVRLADYRGQVVVVDFWATWCIPCLQALPHLNRFARWVAEENQPVKVFAVNTMEEHESFEERVGKIEQFWSERNMDVPLVYDVENRAVNRTGYVNIPLLLVIDPEGRITRVKDRFNRNMYPILKAEVERALQGAGGPATETTEPDEGD